MAALCCPGMTSIFALPTILEKGYVYDFSEFDKVIDGKPGPFLPKFINRIKKFGIKDNFILTARPTNSAASIQLFLKEGSLFFFK